MMSPILLSLTLALGQTAPGENFTAPGFRASASIGVFSPVVYSVPQEPEKVPVAPQPKNGNGNNGNGNGKNGNGNGKKKEEEPRVEERRGFIGRLFKAYYDAIEAGLHKDDRLNPPKKEGENEEPEEPKPERRALPEPWSSPPFPGHEYQGYPLIGVPRDDTEYPLMKAIHGIDFLGIGQWFKDNHIKIYGWVDASGNFSTSTNTNTPTAYWNAANSFQLDQAVLRFEREADTVQTEKWDWGFRSTWMYGEDYRYTTAGGYLSDQLLKNNRLYGLDPIEQYLDVYVPGIFEGMVVRAGRWVACPDIETQLAPDNYMGSHSILFTFDTYTVTGAMCTWKLNDQNLFQLGLTAGTDMAPWYPGATPSGFIGWRWVSEDNNDAFYTCVNQLNDAIFRKNTIDGQPAGHDNFNYVVSTWEHRFNEWAHTKTEAYFMWQRDAYVGGTANVGPLEWYGGGGGLGTYIPGYSIDYGVLNYTMFAFSKSDYVTLRNEIWNDPQGERSGIPDLYSSHSIGISHFFNPLVCFRPEVDFYHSYGAPAFNNGTQHSLFFVGFDFYVRF